MKMLNGQDGQRWGWSEQNGVEGALTVQCLLALSGRRGDVG